MKLTSPVRASLLAILMLLLSGCAGMDVIRGQLNYDLRPADQRSDVYWPPAPDQPRYKYVGELVGQPNFIASKATDAKSTAISVLKWFVGLFDTESELMLARPQHGAVDSEGRVYVVDAGRNAVLVFDPNALDENGQSLGEGQLLVWSEIEEKIPFASPISVVIAWDGNIAVSDAKLGLVALLDRSGKLVAKLGKGQLERPTGLAYDNEHALLYVSDTVTHEVKVFNRTGQLVRTLGGPGEEDARFNAPTQLAYVRGRLYVSDTLNSRVQVFDSDGRRVSGLGQRGLYVGNLTRPKGVAVDQAGIIYVIESYFAHLLAYNQQGEFLLGINGSGLQGGEFMLPSGVWTDGADRLFVADMFNGRVVVFQFLGNTGL